MNTAPAAPWRRLAPLAGGVLAVHLLALHAMQVRHVEAPAPVARFATRTVALPAPPTAVPDGTTGLPKPAPRAPRRSVVSAANPDVHPTPRLTPPPPATFHYEVLLERQGHVQHGTARLDWTHDGRDYALRLALSGPFPPRIQSSRGRLTPQGLQPDYFHEQARGERAVHFDREGGRIVFSANSPQAALAAGAQDRISVVMQAAMLLAADPARIVAGARIALPTAGTRESGEWLFAVEGEEDLVLPGGALRAWKLERAPRHAYDQRIELWLAPGRDYAPVRLRLTNPDGGVVDQRWSSTDRG